MNKKKLIGLVISFIGIISLTFLVLNGKIIKKISNLEIYLLVGSFILIMSGFSYYQNSKEHLKRKRYINFSLPTSLIIVFIGFLFKYLRVPSASFLVISGTFYLCFGIIPVIAKNRFDRWNKYTKSKIQIIGLMLCDSIGLVLILLSIVFYIQKWPGSLIMMILGLIMIVLAFLLWNRKFETLFKFQIEAKNLLEETHKEITDSINYAKRLQDAILPSFLDINQHIKSNFILFQPKDVVSGDFYWFENKNNISLIASADCTGHGVPGAMVSVVCSNALHRSVNEFGIIEPSKILDKTRELVIETFAKSGEDVKDGMDIALCALSDNKVVFSGANNPLWIVRNINELTSGQIEHRSTCIIEELALIEFKANKQPIGLYEGMKPFTQTEINLLKGDTLYFFTDGFADQFGGEKGKKFKYKPFKRLLIEISTKPMEEQKEIIKNTFNNWKGNIEQVDDVCIIGIKIT